MLTSVNHNVTGAGQEYFYDDFCRVTKVKENITPSEFYETATTYDRYGRIEQLTYPNNALAIKHVYNERGHPPPNTYTYELVQEFIFQVNVGLNIKIFNKEK